MSEVLERPDLESALAAAHRAVDALLAGDLTPCTDEQVVTLLRDTDGDGQEGGGAQSGDGITKVARVKRDPQ